LSAEEERLSNLEKRLVPNVEFDDQELYTLGFGTDIYYMLGEDHVWFEDRWMVASLCDE
jgi:hypothetical protein